MPKQTRHSTAYSGVYFVELADDDQSFLSVTSRMARVLRKGQDVPVRAGTLKKHLF